jgi:hypothetical protein
MIIPPQHLKRRHRREMIAEQLTIDRDQVMLLGDRSEGVGVGEVLGHLGSLILRQKRHVQKRRETFCRKARLCSGIFIFASASALNLDFFNANAGH